MNIFNYRKEGVSHPLIPEVYDKFCYELKTFCKRKIYDNKTYDRKLKNYGMSGKINKIHDLYNIMYYIYFSLYKQSSKVCLEVKKFMKRIIHPGLLHFPFEKVGWKGKLGIAKKYANRNVITYYSRKEVPIKTLLLKSYLSMNFW